MTEPKDAKTLAMELDAAVLEVAYAAQELANSTAGAHSVRGESFQLVGVSAFEELQDAIKAWRAAGEAFVQAQRRPR